MGKSYLLVDTHCHLYFNNFEEDRDLVIARARGVGITRILNPGIDLQTSREAIDLSNHYPEVYAAVGVHPNEALQWTDSSRQELKELCNHRKVIAIGEIGLDYYRKQSPEDLQTFIFSEQLSLAADVDLPVIIHLRDSETEDHVSFRDMLQILEDWVRLLKDINPDLVDRPGVMHSFDGNEEEADQFVKMKMRIGIPGQITFKNAGILSRIVQNLPLETILVETDAPFLTPVPHRGKRNEPSYIKYTVEKISQLRSVGFEEIAKATLENSERLFCWNAVQ